MFQTQAQPFADTNSPNYTVMGSGIYKGSSAVGVITDIDVLLAGGNNNTETDFRIFDLTNANVIAEVTGVTGSTVFQIINMGALSNIPGTQAVIEFQMRRSSGPGSSRVAACLFSLG